MFPGPRYCLLYFFGAVDKDWLHSKATACISRGCACREAAQQSSISKMQPSIVLQLVSVGGWPHTDAFVHGVCVGVGPFVDACRHVCSCVVVDVVVDIVFVFIVAVLGSYRAQLGLSSPTIVNVVRTTVVGIFMMA